MKLTRAAIAFAFFCVLASSGFAQGYGGKAAPGTDNGEMTATLRALEVKVNDAFKNRDTKTFFSSVDPNAWSIDAMGFTPVSEISEMMKDIDVKSYSIEGYKTMMIDPSTYLATFTWKGDVTYKGQPFPPVTYCSTVWAKRGKEWKAVFHQESLPMEGTPAPTAASH